eukprot:Hpha_TRINITY_DN10576_c0_g1::TRINITY_DN10576_c0_g1_i1::g.31420::m.31420
MDPRAPVSGSNLHCSQCTWSTAHRGGHIVHHLKDAHGITEETPPTPAPGPPRASPPAAPSSKRRRSVGSVALPARGGSRAPVSGGEAHSLRSWAGLETPTVAAADVPLPASGPASAAASREKSQEAFAARAVTLRKTPPRDDALEQRVRDVEKGLTQLRLSAAATATTSITFPPPPVSPTAAPERSRIGAMVDAIRGLVSPSGRGENMEKRVNNVEQMVTYLSVRLGPHPPAWTKQEEGVLWSVFPNGHIETRLAAVEAGVEGLLAWRDAIVAQTEAAPQPVDPAYVPEAMQPARPSTYGPGSDPPPTFFL